MLTVYEFIDLCIDSGCQMFSIWDNATESVLWTGRGYDLPDHLEEYTVNGFDPIGKDMILTINIDTEE